MTLLKLPPSSFSFLSVFKNTYPGSYKEFKVANHMFKQIYFHCRWFAFSGFEFITQECGLLANYCLQIINANFLSAMLRISIFQIMEDQGRDLYRASQFVSLDFYIGKQGAIKKKLSRVTPLNSVKGKKLPCSFKIKTMDFSSGVGRFVTHCLTSRIVNHGITLFLILVIYGFCLKSKRLTLLLSQGLKS